MKELQLKILKASLNDKWLPSLEELKLAEKIDNPVTFRKEVYKTYNYLTSWKTCVCCIEWYNKFCIGCPISEYTGEKKCRKTPYEKMSYEYDYFRSTGNINGIINVIQEECDFQSMLINKLEKECQTK